MSCGMRERRADGDVADLRAGPQVDHRHRPGRLVAHQADAPAGQDRGAERVGAARQPHVPHAVVIGRCRRSRRCRRGSAAPAGGCRRARRRASAARRWCCVVAGDGLHGLRVGHRGDGDRAEVAAPSRRWRSSRRRGRRCPRPPADCPASATSGRPRRRRRRPGGARESSAMPPEAPGMGMIWITRRRAVSTMRMSLAPTPADTVQRKRPSAVTAPPVGKLPSVTCAPCGVSWRPLSRKPVAGSGALGAADAEAATSPASDYDEDDTQGQSPDSHGASPPRGRVGTKRVGEQPLPPAAQVTFHVPGLAFLQPGGDSHIGRPE